MLNCIKGEYGTLILNGDGTWRYVLDNMNPAVRALGKDDTLQENFSVVVRDQHGASSEQQLGITIHGKDHGTGGPGHVPVVPVDSEMHLNTNLTVKEDSANASDARAAEDRTMPRADSRTIRILCVQRQGQRHRPAGQ